MFFNVYIIIIAIIATIILAIDMSGYEITLDNSELGMSIKRKQY